MNKAKAIEKYLDKYGETPCEYQRHKFTLSQCFTMELGGYNPFDIDYLWMTIKDLSNRDEEELNDILVCLKRWKRLGKCE